MHLAQSDVIPAAETHMVGVINAAFPSVTAPVILTLVLVLDLPFSWYCISWMYFFRWSAALLARMPSTQLWECECSCGFPVTSAVLQSLEAGAETRRRRFKSNHMSDLFGLHPVAFKKKIPRGLKWRGQIRMTSANDNTIKSALFCTSHINKNKIVT